MTFPCTRCGACCRLVSVVPALAHLDRGDGACRHLTGEAGGEHGCAVYADRPRECSVDAMRPEVLTPAHWYRQNAAWCDRLHLAVYGQPRAHG